MTTPVATASAAIDSLTGIRGVAAVWVFLTHYQAVIAGYLQSPSVGKNALLYNGFRGVDLFFVLSGFILMHVHGRDFTTIGAGMLRRFYTLRFYRIVPLNTAVLLALLALTLALPEIVTWFRMDHGVPIPFHARDFSMAGFLQSLVLAQAWTVVKLGEWNGPAWSLSAEMFGYACFPLLACGLMRRGSALACAALAASSLAVLMLLLFLGHHTSDSPTGTFGLVRMVFGFTAGACLARCFQLRTTLADQAKLGRMLAWLSIAMVAACLSWAPANMFIVFGFAGLIYALALQSGCVNGWLASPIAMFLGRISFSLYMVHYVPLRLSLWMLPAVQDSSLVVRAAWLAAIPIGCFVLAIAAYRWVELPFQRFARALSRRQDIAPSHAVLVS